MKIAAGFLCAQHIGRRINIRYTNDTEVTGILASVLHRADVISERQIASRDEQESLGAPYVRIELLGVREMSRLWPEHVVEVSVL